MGKQDKQNGLCLCVIKGGLINAIDDLRLRQRPHTLVSKLCGHDQCYFLKGKGGRIICTAEEQDCLISYVEDCLQKPVTTQDIAWSRPILGLRLLTKEINAIDEWIDDEASKHPLQYAA